MNKKLFLIFAITVFSASCAFAEVALSDDVAAQSNDRFLDRIKIEGLFRLDYVRDEANPWAWYYPDNGTSTHDFKEENTDTKNALLRLDGTADITPEWKVKSRAEGNFDFSESTTEFDIVQAYAEGNFRHSVNVKLGAFGDMDSENLINGGFIIDKDRVTGGAIVVGNQIKLKYTVGKIDKDSLVLSHGAESNAALQVVKDKWKPSYYQGWETYGSAGKWAWSLGYHINENDMLERSFGTKKEEVAGYGLDYHFDRYLTLGLFYSHGMLLIPETDYFGNKDEKEGYSVQFTYREADKEVQGSYDTWIAYRHIGSFSALYPTFDGVQLGAKGVELGVDYVVAPRVVARLVGMWGKTINSGEITQKARVAPKWIGGHAEERDTSHILTRIEYYF